MLSDPERETIQQLHQKGMGVRQISRTLGHARATIRQVLNGSAPTRVPAGPPPVALAELFKQAEGNVARVQELLQARGTDVPYSTLTHWVRQHGLRTPKPRRAGHYTFEPGAEMQHDTSPHRLTLAGKTVRAQCAALVLGYSRYAFMQYYPRFTRFEARAFLQTALAVFGGAATRCTIDNTSVLVVAGSGPDATIAPELARWGALFGTRFIPHAIGHADRKAHVERFFAFVEGRFLPGRVFTDWADLNTQARNWCETVANAKVKRSLGRSPAQAWVEERPALQPLPKVLPPVYALCHRVVDTQGYVSLDRNRYSVPERYLGQQVEIYTYLVSVQICARGQTIARTDLYAVQVRVDLHLLAQITLGHGVAVTVQRDVALGVDHPVAQRIDRRQHLRQRLQRRSFLDPGRGRRALQTALDLGIGHR
ncbi:MAG: helix-turn-helix domain-containing protein, partial [Ectothiorhodospiraceae bacterium]